MATKIPPAVAAALKEAGMTLGRIGYKALSAGVAEALKGVGEFTAEVDRRVQRGSKAARKMAETGQPYEPEEEEEEEDAQR